MALLRSGSLDVGPTLYGDGVYLRPPVMSDYPQWAEIRQESRSFLKPWEPAWPRDDLTRAAFKKRVKRYQREIREDLAYPFMIFHSATDEILGGLTLSYIRRGVAQAGCVGYWVGVRYIKKGVMTRAMETILPFAFETLKLNRLEAACLPNNAGSIALLEKVGFEKEGYAKRYLCINGVWQDHLLYAMLAHDFFEDER